MTFTNDFNARLTAAFAAVSVTMMLLVSSFSTPHGSALAGLFA